QQHLHTNTAISAPPSTGLDGVGTSQRCVRANSSAEGLPPGQLISVASSQAGGHNDPPLGCSHPPRRRSPLLSRFVLDRRVDLLLHRLEIEGRGVLHRREIDGSLGKV